MNTTAGRAGRPSRDRGAAATEFGLLLSLVSVLVTGSIAALLTQVWHFDPCEIFQMCSSGSGQSPPGATGDGSTQGDTSAVAPTTAPTPSPAPSPSDCPGAVAGVADPPPGPDPSPTDCPPAPEPSVP